MKKIGLLNQPLSNVIAGMGHTDTLVVSDAGLPIPVQTERIDLALKQGVPGFIEVVKTVLDELKVERAIIASEMQGKSPAMHKALTELLGNIPVEAVAHETFKSRTTSARAVVRSGEFTPFSNVILVAGVVF